MTTFYGNRTCGNVKICIAVFAYIFDPQMTHKMRTSREFAIFNVR